MKINLANIKKAQKLLNKGECVAIPTETVYGLAANAYSDKACKKIYKLKKRPKKNPLIVHYLNSQILEIDCKLNKDFQKLDRVGDKSINNYLSSIQASKKITFSKFIYALGIREVGESSSRALASEFKSIEDKS